eukprot:CAMPEP_0117666734 /NCGR_PEP_ID=MMETSP0804-20121206/10548_1 /TAXON_ID=1074897 /ORGANISM="Tetraselmis astigmatica, Strain CCMP880" /LENGTH=335 /DNA_ID=CAMNT_0005474327 /DNA_START=61 /DNA_END=1069 /DNA_ORIENTATION=+
MLVNPRGRKDARQARQKRAWQVEAERDSVSPPPSLPAERSPSPGKEPRPAEESPPAERSCLDVFGGRGAALTHNLGGAEGRNSVVYFDVEMGGLHVKKGKLIGRLEMELFGRDCPKTAENFRQLCSAASGGLGKTTGLPLTYLDCPFHRIIPGFMAQGGDFQRGDGTGGESIYGGNFEDENFKHRHTTRGLLSMANSGRNTNGSQFFITFGRAPHLDGKHCVFGRVISGFQVLDAIEAMGSRSGDPKQQVKITGCGEVKPPATTSGGGSRKDDRPGHVEARGGVAAPARRGAAAAAHKVGSGVVAAAAAMDESTLRGAAAGSAPVGGAAAQPTAQ